MDLEQKEEHKQITIKDVVEEKICNENIDGDIHTWMNVVNVNVDLHIQRNENVAIMKNSNTIFSANSISFIIMIYWIYFVQP